MAEAFGTTWQNVFRSVKHAVSWGLAHRDLSGVVSLGVDAYKDDPISFFKLTSADFRSIQGFLGVQEEKKMGEVSIDIRAKVRFTASRFS